MELGIRNLKEKEPFGVGLEEKSLNFICTEPLIIQPLEIQKMKAQVILDIPDGYVLYINSSSFLVNKAGELFPSIVVLDNNSPKEPLFIDIRNNGRNPLHLMVSNHVAVGRLVKIENITPVNLEVEYPENQLPKKSRPQKKNNFQFEVK